MLGSPARQLVRCGLFNAYIDESYTDVYDSG
jgi:hypothetical protein